MWFRNIVWVRIPNISNKVTSNGPSIVIISVSLIPNINPKRANLSNVIKMLVPEKDVDGDAESKSNITRPCLYLAISYC